MLDDELKKVLEVPVVLQQPLYVTTPKALHKEAGLLGHVDIRHV